MKLGSRTRSRGRRDGGATSVDPLDSSYAQQQRALCEFAQNAMRRRMQSNAEIFAKAAKSIHSERMYEAYGEQFTTKLDDLGFTTPESSKQLAEALAQLYAERGPRIRAAVASGEYDVLLRELQALFRAEDELVRSLLGTTALNWFRAELLEHRTLLLAHTAAHADIPWDESLAW